MKYIIRLILLFYVATAWANKENIRIMSFNIPYGNIKGTLDFLCTGEVEAWNPMTGRPERISATGHYRRTSVELRLQRGECIFVVFVHDKKMKGDFARTRIKKGLRTNLGELDSLQWTLTFPEGWGIEKPLSLAGLKPWRELDLPIVMLLPTLRTGRAGSFAAKDNVSLCLNHHDDIFFRHVV